MPHTFAFAQRVMVGLAPPFAQRVMVGLAPPFLVIHPAAAI
ncbi:MAG: hypothetical protein ACYSW8_10950 [Planctomycetota bacterium]